MICLVSSSPEPQVTTSQMIVFFVATTSTSISPLPSNCRKLWARFFQYIWRRLVDWTQDPLCHNQKNMITRLEKQTSSLDILLIISKIKFQIYSLHACIRCIKTNTRPQYSHWKTNFICSNKQLMTEWTVNIFTYKCWVLTSALWCWQLWYNLYISVSLSQLVIQTSRM